MGTEYGTYPGNWTKINIPTFGKNVTVTLSTTTGRAVNLWLYGDDYSGKRTEIQLITATTLTKTVDGSVYKTIFADCNAGGDTGQANTIVVKWIYSD